MLVLSRSGALGPPPATQLLVAYPPLHCCSVAKKIGMDKVPGAAEYQVGGASQAAPDSGITKRP